MGQSSNILEKNLTQSNYTPPATGSTQMNVGRTERIISAAGGALLAAIGMRKLNREGIAFLLAGGALFIRGASGYCPINTMIDRDTANSLPSPVSIRKSIRVNRDREKVYQFWRNLENLPKFMTHLKKVEELDFLRSKWTADFPGDAGLIEWEAEILREDENKLIKWQSIPGSKIDNSGEVRFSAVGRNITNVQVNIAYRAPLGDLGTLAAKLVNPLVNNMVKQDLEQFKQVVEAAIPEEPTESYAESSQSRLQPSIH